VTQTIQLVKDRDLKRNLAEARQLLHQREAFQEGRVVCPAGKFVRETTLGSACRCVIEQATIAEGDSPVSLLDFCFGDYTACPTWREEKRRIEEDRKTFLIDRKPARPAVRRELRELGDGILTIDGPRDGRDEAAQG
jgi:hypothetical protein